jgi:formylmethanofuran:tetrahydromethanopterin formyltransferase
MKAELIEDTYAEAFDGIYSRLLITAKNEKLLEKEENDRSFQPDN